MRRARSSGFWELPEEGRRGRILIWLLGSVALSFFHAAVWVRIVRSSEGFRLPMTPIDRVSADGAAQWRLLMDARPWIPKGSKYTVHASDAEREMNLYMLSIGVFPQSQPLPTRYFGMDFSAVGNQARYVIDEGCRESGKPGFRMIARLPGGCVERRE